MAVVNITAKIWLEVTNAIVQSDWCCHPMAIAATTSMNAAVTLASAVATSALTPMEPTTALEPFTRHHH